MPLPYVFSFVPSQANGYTFLELCQQFMAECGISGTLTTVAGQTGEMLRVVSWVQQAWRELQGARDWDFMRASYLNTGASYPFPQGTSFTTTYGQSVYPLGTTAGTTCMVNPSSFRKWDKYSFRCYTTSNTNKTDEIPIEEIGYDRWRESYMLGALRLVRTRPVTFAISPTKAICLGPPSNGNYTIEGDYWVNPQVLVLDDDVPLGLLSEYHMIIVYKAMYKYASYEAAPDVRVRADDQYWPMYRELLSRYGEEAQMTGALA